MSAVQWFIPPGLGEIGRVPAPCPESGRITDVVMWTNLHTILVALTQQPDPGYGGDPIFDSPHATYQISPSEWVRVPYNDPTAYGPWDGGVLTVNEGDPLWIETDGFFAADMLVFAALIDSGGGHEPTSIAAGAATSGLIPLSGLFTG